MYTNILQVCFVQAHSGLHGSLLRAAHMPELRSGIVAALLEKTWKVLSSCKHDCEISMSSLIATRAKRQSRFPAGSASKIHNMNTPEIYYYRRLLYVRLYEYCKPIIINSLCFIPAGLEKWCPQFNASINITYH